MFYCMFYFTCDRSLKCPIHTADADATQLSSCVASASAVCIGLKDTVPTVYTVAHE